MAAGSNGFFDRGIQPKGRQGQAGTDRQESQKREENADSGNV